MARQLEQSFFEAPMRRVWAIDGDVAKRSFKQRPVQAENQRRRVPAAEPAIGGSRNQLVQRGIANPSHEIAHDRLPQTECDAHEADRHAPRDLSGTRHSTEQKQGSVTERRRCAARMRGAHVPTRVQRGTEAPTPRTQCLRSCLAEAASGSAPRVASRVEASRPVADRSDRRRWLTMRQG